MRVDSFYRWLICAFAFIACMIAVRFFITGTVHFLFLVWNLFLATIPLFCSLFLKSKKVPSTIQNILFFAWLLFFPNSLYMITDLIHLKDSGIIPLWFDAALLFVAAFTALIIAFASLKNADNFFAAKFRPRSVKLFPLLALSAGSFGVYLGRFDRFNSWDVFSQPTELLTEIILKILHPLQHSHAWAVTLFLTGLYLLLWESLQVIKYEQRVKELKKAKSPTGL